MTLIFCGCKTIEPQPDFGYHSPDRFEQKILTFETADTKAIPPEGTALFVGSSSIRIWHKTLAEDMAPLTVIGRGFGGSDTNDLLHFYDRVVFKYQRHAVVIYEGDNDATQGISRKASSRGTAQPQTFTGLSRCSTMPSPKSLETVISAAKTGLKKVTAISSSTTGINRTDMAVRDIKLFIAALSSS